MEEEPWRYCYNDSKLNEPISIAIEWLSKYKVTTSQREASSKASEGIIPALDKGKRKVVGNTEAEKRCKFKVDPLVLKAAF